MQRLTRLVTTWHCLLAAGGLAAEPATWPASGTLNAPEAVQAAAADDRFVYAIANAQIARYDRTSGERVAVSTGEARHLNSGFLWQGRLYCAHSNYPLVPERSEIKVLDTESMRLTTLKDFGNYEGSLTWAVLEDGHWWCNFARYGDDNAQTFLVKFDRDWHELVRWTYPAALIRRLGRYSLSGGVWRGGELLVTGHDDPVLFRLRLPRQGNVLELVGEDSIPFTGQGIAHDPRSGGLVGIQRAKKQVVFSAAPVAAGQRLRVLSYNIHHGEGVDGRLDLERIARVILAAEPDLVALQEVDRRVTRSGSVDQPVELAKLTKLHAAFGGNIELQGGEYGNAVLSRHPIRSQRNHKLPNRDRGEQRGVLELEIDIAGWPQPLWFFATHLDHRQADEERFESTQAINRLVLQQELRPAVLAGDLNAASGSRVLDEFVRQWRITNELALPTIPVGRPTRQIDFILLRPAARWKAIETQVLDEAKASDHRPILSVLELQPAPPAR